MDQSLAMGGYAGYLMAAYGVTAVVVVGNIIAARRRFRRTTQRLRDQLARRAGRAGGPGQADEQSSGGARIRRES
jgi:heme exporter protein CcmD